MSQKLKQKIWLNVSLSAIFLVLLCASMLLEMQNLAKQQAVAQGGIDQVYAALFPGSTAGGEYYQLQAKLKELRSKNDFMPHALTFE